MSSVIVVLVLALVFYSVYLKNNTYNSFVKGVKNALDLVVSVFPYIFAVFVILELLKSSGLSSKLSEILSPIFSLLKIPKELIELIIIKFLSGSGSLAVLENIYLNYGVDSFVGKVASIITSSSEALFYVLPVLFSSTKISKFRYGIFVAIICNFITIVLASFICNYI
ncbi:MAG: nucleoside recognition protein [Clostridia bacterium]|nr:nucleoside recognition protein [Clostridia bacterium]